jgi:phage-related protein
VDFLALADQKGMLKDGVKTMQIVDWLKQDFDLGRGHAMALIVTFNAAKQPHRSTDEQIADHFKAKTAIWRKPYNELIEKVRQFGNDISVKPGNSYLSIVRGSKKFAILQFTANRMDIGIKRKNTTCTERFEAAGTWNSMVTHRVRITDPRQVDGEVLDWLHRAYIAASN